MAINTAPQPPRPVSQIARIFGCTIEQARAQYIANAEQMETLAARSRETGRKVRGFTADCLAERAAAFRAAATA